MNNLAFIHHILTFHQFVSQEIEELTQIWRTFLLPVVFEPAAFSFAAPESRHVRVLRRLIADTLVSRAAS